jgi:putative zinc finger protein
MPEETKHGIQCTEFEALLSEAIEGELTGAQKEGFEAHRRVCAVCGPLFAEVQAGHQWLRALEQVEPPAHLVHNILAATTGISSTRVLATTPETGVTPLAERVREWWDSFFTPVFAFVRQPRFVMSFGMIFFSLSLILNTAGVKAADVAKIDLRPKGLRHTYNDLQVRVVKYYDNIRFVYEIESKVREIKRATRPAEPAAEPQKENPKNNTSGQPDQRQDRNYSRDENQPVLAGLMNSETRSAAASFALRAASNHVSARSSWLVARSSDDEAPPVVAATMNRRFV